MSIFLLAFLSDFSIQRFDIQLAALHGQNQESLPQNRLYDTRFPILPPEADERNPSVSLLGGLEAGVRGK